MITELQIAPIALDRAFSTDEHAYWAWSPFFCESAVLTVAAESRGRLLVGYYDHNWLTGISWKLIAEGQGTISCTLPLAVGENQFYIQCGEQEYLLHITRVLDEVLLYRESLRPQFHFSPAQFSLNDPNGLCYDAVTSEYLMFFQCDRPFRCAHQVDGNQKSWGLAVSTDLIHWRDQGLVITPDENGVIWSGCCVIDRENTSGLFDETTWPEARIVALFTYHGGTKPENGLRAIGLAFSCDHGRSFHKPFSAPVIPNTDNEYGSELRDPKVIWFEDPAEPGGGLWVMVAAGGRAQLFTSHDLIHWRHERDLCRVDGTPLESECPELFCLCADDMPERPVWVYSGCGVFYILGALVREADGRLNFRAETAQTEPVNGFSELYPGTGLYPELYAAQGFYNEPRGRHVEISWMRDLLAAEGKHWYNALSLAHDVTLKTVNGILRLQKYPVEELKCLRGAQLASLRNVKLRPDGRDLLHDLRQERFDLELIFQPDADCLLRLEVGRGSTFSTVITYDAHSKMLTTDKTASSPHISGVYATEMQPMPNGEVWLRVLADRAVLDVYGNGGQVFHNGYTFAAPENRDMSLQVLRGEALVKRLELWEMDTIFSELPEILEDAEETPTEGPANTMQ